MTTPKEFIREAIGHFTDFENAIGADFHADVSYFRHRPTMQLIGVVGTTRGTDAFFVGVSFCYFSQWHDRMMSLDVPKQDVRAGIATVVVDLGARRIDDETTVAFIGEWFGDFTKRQIQVICLATVCCTLGDTPQPLGPRPPPPSVVNTLPPIAAVSQTPPTSAPALTSTTTTTSTKRTREKDDNAVSSSTATPLVVPSNVLTELFYDGGPSVVGPSLWLPALRPTASVVPTTTATTTATTNTSTKRAREEDDNADEAKSARTAEPADNKCLVCLTELATVLALPCAHAVLCVNCQPAFAELRTEAARKCLRCRTATTHYAYPNNDVRPNSALALPSHPPVEPNLMRSPTPAFIPVLNEGMREAFASQYEERARQALNNGEGSRADMLIEKAVRMRRAMIRTPLSSVELDDRGYPREVRPTERDK